MFDSSASNAKFLKVSDAARQIGISPPTVRRLVQDGKLAGIHIGGLVLIERASFERFMQCTDAQPLAKAA
jgi:excisionase family DNA binding protein